jgi:hypothetical protein
VVVVSVTGKSTVFVAVKVLLCVVVVGVTVLVSVVLVSWGPVAVKTTVLVAVKVWLCIVVVGVQVLVPVVLVSSPKPQKQVMFAGHTVSTMSPSMLRHSWPSTQSPGERHAMTDSGR